MCIGTNSVVTVSKTDVEIWHRRHDDSVMGHTCSSRQAKLNAKLVFP